MKKILLILFVLLANISFAQYGIDENAIYLDINKNVGIGIKAPTSRLHVFGNGTSSNMFNLTNDKDGVKDSSVIINAIGNVGIGKETPTAKLYVQDTTSSIGGSIPVAYIRAAKPNKIALGAVSISVVNEITPDYNIGLYASSMGGTNNFAGYFNKGDVYIDNNLGIGRFAPTYRLDVFGNGGTDNLLKVSNDINSTYDSTFVVNKVGKVGIGTTTPAAKFHIDGNKISPNDLVYVTNDKDYLKDSTFIINSKGFVAIGSNTAYHPLHVWGSANGGANIYSEYSGSSISSAIKGYATGSAGFGIIGAANTIGTAGGFFQNTASGIALDLKSDNGIAIMVRSGYVIIDSTQFHSLSTTLSDNEAYYFPTNLSWKGEIDVDSLGYTLFTAQIRCDANGTPYLEGVSWKRWSSKTYVEVGSTDGYFNIYDAGSGMAIKNSLGYTIKATLRFRAKQ